MNVAEKEKLLDSIDARSKLAGSNKMEVLLFSLGTRETFGINVFKVREVTKTPLITRTPNMPAGVEGVISLRGNIIPVINLARYVNIGQDSASSGATMMVTEFSQHTQAFLVHEVDRIIRVDWERIKAPDNVVAGNQSLITAITELDSGKLVSILDVEQILSSAFGEVHVGDIAKADKAADKFLLFADDSSVARKKIGEVLDKLSIKYQVATSGREAWDKLQAIAQRAQDSGAKLSEQISVILTDAEMPEMDGYVLTKNVKGDSRFNGIPVVMHSSLSSEANRALGKTVGVDAYVPKFDPQVLAEVLRPLLAERTKA
jgi:two-component system, chemotaxis family, chemotaxis protein CheV